MLPFLKKRDDGVATGPVETKVRDSDKPSDYGMLDAIAEDLLTAIEKKDKSRLKAALESLCDHIQSADMEQDNETIGEF